MLNVLSYKRNANQNDTKIPLPHLELLPSIKQTKNGSEYMGKKEPLFSICEYKLFQPPWKLI
jgi:hypothetical protein